MLVKLTPESNDIFALNPQCEEGFVPDYASGYCYAALTGHRGLKRGLANCQFYYDAEIVKFDSNQQVGSFIKLIERGNLFLNEVKLH